MKIKSEILIQELLHLTENHLEKVNSWKELPDEIWQYRPQPGAWNALECLEHLNYYGEFYLKEIENQMKNSTIPSQEYFHSGILGNYFAQMMLPKERGGKMKTFKEMNPIGKNLHRNVIDTFIGQQKKILELLTQTESKNLTKIKTSISILKWIKLRLGDTLRVVIFHNERHIQQAEKALFA
jgi:hypothetical protein